MSRARGRRLALVPGLGLVHAAVGALAPPSGPGTGAAALVRLVLATACAVALVFGPGLALRAVLAGRGRRLPLALAGLPGPALLAATGGLCWWGATGAGVNPRLTSGVVLVPVLAWVALVAWGQPAPAGLHGHARKAALVAMAVLAIAVAKGTWSPGPAGELYGGTVSRTLEVGARSDSRISFHVVQLVANGTSPYSDLGRMYFAPWTFSDRGPLAGLAASPVVLLSGADVPVTMPDQPWSPFDREGFAAYRLTLSAMAVTALLALFALTARWKGAQVGLQATLLAALTPFVVHESYFTWPKLQAAGMVLAAATLLLDRRPGWAGLLAGVAYLVHPMALFSLVPLALLWLVVARGGERRPVSLRAFAGVASMAAGAFVSLALWRVLNGDEYNQSGFVQYVLNANGGRYELGTWVSARVTSVLNTLVPLHVVLADGDHPAMNSITGPSSGPVRFFLQYWTSLPFAVGIAALPVAVVRWARAARRWPVVFTATAVVPLAAFAVYWGADRTGLLREGMHVWVLTLVALAAATLAPAGGEQAPVSRVEAAAWSLRGVEVLLLLTVPALATGAGIYGADFVATDLVALAVMVAATAWLVRETFVTLLHPPATVAEPAPVPGDATMAIAR